MNSQQLCYRVALLALLAAVSGHDRATAQSKAPNIDLKVATWNKTLADIKAFKGQVVVVDMWSTSCIPCMKEFPNLVKLQAKYGKRVVCISFNCDYLGIVGKPPESYRGRALKFLTKQRASFLNILSSTPSDELFDQIDLGSIPAIYVFDTSGRLAHRFDNDDRDNGDEFTYKAHVVPLVEKLLNTK
ncbi:MAG: TlpA disulfide reductase family protein [Planctomycetaceae bacterium]